MPASGENQAQPETIVSAVNTIEARAPRDNLRGG
jgi:hypothetical protein